MGKFTSPITAGVLLSVTDVSRYEPMGTEEGPKPKIRDDYESLKVRYTLPQSPQPIPETNQSLLLRFPAENF